MLSDIGKIYQTGLLAPSGLGRLAGSFFRCGVNLMALMRYAAKRFPRKVAITDDTAQHTYCALYTRTLNLATTLHTTYGLAPGHKVAISCRNHASLVSAIFAASATGADIYMLSPEMSAAQLSAICARHNFHLFIHDADLAPKLPASLGGLRLPAYGADGDSVASLCEKHTPAARRYERAGNLVVLTGGTTGEHKTAPRRQGVARYVSPLLALISGAALHKSRSVFIGTPICHGYGLAALFMAVLLGNEVCLTTHFAAPAACTLIRTRKADTAVIVPIMLQRMLAHDASALASLSKVISGGAALSEALAQHTLATLGPVLCNLYGTSEAGVSLMALPADLAMHPGTIGRAIPGVELRITGCDGRTLDSGQVGHLHLRNRWAMNQAAGQWIATGDLARIDEEGYCYLMGRTDDMIISGGMNVYPLAIENALLQHPAITECAVVGVADEEFGQRLVAFAVAEGINGDELRQWLKDKVARYEMPREIRVVETLPYTAMGKPDKRTLQAQANHNIF